MLRLLPKKQISAELCDEGQHIVASFFADEVEGGTYRHYGKYDLLDFPNCLASADDLKRFGIDLVNGKPIRSC